MTEDVLAIVGSTTFVCPRGPARAAEIIGRVLDLQRPDRVVSGQSPYGGVDALAEQAATVRGIPFTGYPPAARRWGGPGGYAERNLRIAGPPTTRLLRIACDETRSYGSGWTADKLAKRLGEQAVERWYITSEGLVIGEDEHRRRVKARTRARRCAAGQAALTAGEPR